MDIEVKLDQIIQLLIRIENKLQQQSAQVIVPPEVLLSPKPTKSQLEFKRMIEFAAEMDRKFFFSAIRKFATRYIEIRKHDANHKLRFTPQFATKIDEKIKKTGAQFYKDLKTWTENYSRAVEAEGEQVLQRAIARLTARS